MIKAVIFDLDGTMVDTEHIWRKASIELAIKHGKIFDEKVTVKMMGRKESEAIKVFIEHHKINAEVELLVKQRKNLVIKMTNMASPKKGLYEFLDLIEILQFKKAIATSGFNEFANKIIDALNIRHRFHSIITGDEIKLSKPNPEIFLTTAKRINVSPKECLVIEDAELGIEAAYNAGMKSIAIPNNLSKNHNFSKATKIFDSMAQITEEIIKSF